jgi:hypothetical protein
MTKLGTLSNTIGTVLTVMFLAPAPLLAEPAATARQMLIHAQTRAQDHAAKNEVKRIAERGPILTETPAVTSFSSNPRESIAISSVSPSVAETKIEPPSQPTPSVLRDDSITVPQASTAEPQLASRASVYQFASIAPSETPQDEVSTHSMVTSPAPATAANAAQAAAPVAAPIVTTTTSQDSPAAAPSPVTQPATITTASGKTEPQPAEGGTILTRTETKSETDRNVASKSEATVKQAAKKTTASTRIASSSQVTHQRHARENSAVEFADSDIRPQLQRIINRPEVRSLMAQYGLN